MDTKIIYDFLYQNRHYAFDLVLFWLAFSSVLSYYRAGFINILYKIVALGISMLLSKPILTKICEALKITGLVPTIMCGITIFLILNIIFNYQVDILFGRSRSIIDSLLGGVFGFAQFLLICVAANLLITVLDQKGVSLPKWMHDSISIDKPISTKDPLHGTFTYGILRYITDLKVMEKLNSTWSTFAPNFKSSIKKHFDEHKSDETRTD